MRPGQQPQQQPQQSTPAIAIVGFVLSFTFSIAGLITSIVALQKIKRESLPGKRLAIAGIIISIVLCLPGIFFLFLIIALGGWHNNQAKEDFKPIASQIMKIGGSKICDNGNSGYDIDNTIPWYEVYYRVPDTANLTGKVKSIAAEQGFTLKSDTTFINELKRLSSSDGVYTSPYGDEVFNQKSDYLLAENGGKSLKITINRDTSVALYCRENYGRKQSTGNDAIIDFNVTLPEVNR